MAVLNGEQQLSWDEKGYLVFRNFFSSAQLDPINDLIDNLWQTRESDVAQSVVTDIFLSTDQEQRLYFSDAPDDARGQPYKLNDLYLSFDEIRNVVLEQRLSSLINGLLDGEPMVCNTLNLEYGSQQDMHQDTLYMPSRVTNKMVASWIALEPATRGNGPLILYPGSHKAAPHLFSSGRTNAIGAEMRGYFAYAKSLIAEHGIEPIEFHAEKGDLLIWHSQLLHGGSAIAEQGSTRKSLVTHYFRRKDYLHRFWKIRKQGPGAYYYVKRALVA